MRRDPFAMIAFIGYHVADYVNHWLKIGATLRKPPRIYLVNWFRKGADGKFLWPGYGENMRVLKWIIDRVEGKGAAKETPLGYVPDSLDTRGLSIDEGRIAEANTVSKPEWHEEMKLHAEMVEGKLAGRAPREMLERYAELKSAFA